MKRGIAGASLKFTATMLGLGTACLACCAAPAIGPLLAGIFAGSAFAGVVVHAAGWIAGAGVVGVALVPLLPRQRRKAHRAAIQKRCGCSEEAPEGAKELSMGAAPASSRSQLLSSSRQKEPASP